MQIPIQPDRAPTEGHLPKPAILFLEQQGWRGGAQCVLEEVLSIVGRTHTPLVAFPKPGPFVEKLRRSGVETLILPLGGYRSGRKSLGETLAFGPRSLFCAWRLAGIIRKRRIGLMYVNAPRWLPAGMLAARWAGIPSIFHLHLTLTRKPEIVLAAQAARAATRILACSQTAANVLLQVNPHLAGRMEVVYNPVLVQAAPAPPRIGLPSSAASQSDSLVVGIVGRITPGKGHHLLLHALTHLAGGPPGWKVVVAGLPAPGSGEDARYFELLQAFTQRNGLASAVEWAGQQADMSACYARLDALAIPSTFGEGLPLVVLEAMKSGVPVIGSRIGGIPEVVKDGVNGILIPPGDVTALAAALDRIRSDRAFLDQLRAQASATIDHRFSLDTFHGSIRQVFSELCPLAEVAESASAPEQLGVRV